MKKIIIVVVVVILFFIMVIVNLGLVDWINEVCIYLNKIVDMKIRMMICMKDM